ncbi:MULTISPECIES: ABC transporter permease [unclassified Imperialibacter]|uniref:ABC transporter permease n=1 Tax=unclassified Imperialibacter TaxID=2629706 RepID=UPI0012545900|nr:MULTISPECIES: FtsX-like permease family protein [unclassified Imperialibacter]CAD5282544.1 ABC-type transport system, involved in lipoprotein release, permease component [Imperialibacter sp. 75]CAD5297418.1 ABC-type transport system, involved in lipoprotein release, permease component [Imperialibacter sp. 89]VVT02932.1 ABC-type transport system, involved in lipoprotein release, permease component [Imperialibacter sp. EC-SDR9]
MTTFLRTAFRVFKKDKAFTFINILGLTLGIMSAIIIFLVVKQEMSYEKFHVNLDRIYRINSQTSQKGGFSFLTATPGPLGEALEAEVPGVEESACTYYRRAGNFVIEADGQKREFTEAEGVALLGPSFFKMFSFEVLSGDVNDLNLPDKVFLSETIAKKFFAISDPLEAVGQTLRMDNDFTLSVAGILKDFPANTDFPFTIVVSPETLKDQIDFSSWNRLDNSMNTYFMLAEQADTTGFQSQIDTLIAKNAGSFFARFFNFELQPLSQVHFDNHFSNYNSRTISGTTITGMMVLGAFLLLTACINFINLATANAMKRGKEVGIRKVLGSSSGNLIGQFLGETTLLALISLALSIPLAYLLKPYVEDLIGFPFHFSLFNDPMALGFLALLLVAVVLISGLYPSLVMARFRPSQVIRSGLTGKAGKGSLLRKILVVFQFLISQVLIIGLFVIFSQMDYFINKDLGFAKEGVINIQFPNGKQGKGAAFKGAVQNVSGVEMVTLQNASPSSRSRWVSTYSFEGSSEDTPYSAELKFGDKDYIDMYQLTFLAGRGFLRDDTVTEIVANRKMIEEMGFASPEEALNAKILSGESGVPIVGVVENYHTNGLREPIKAGYISANPESFVEVGIKLNMSQAKESLANIEAIWNDMFPNEPFKYQFLDETIRSFYEAEQRLAKVIGVFTGIAIFIGCLGLYGLVSFVTNQRMKEIGIRKVLGAGLFNIFYIISREFVVLVVVAFVAAAPIAFHYTSEWLDGFEYRVEVQPLVYLVAIVLSLVIALFSVTFKALAAAKINPVDTLRTE